MSGIVGSSHNIRGSGIVAKLGTDGQVFTSAGAGIKQTYEAAGGGDNKPAFLAYLTSAQAAVSLDTWTKIAFNTELFDTDGTYDNSSNFRFTPGTEAKYKLFCQIGCIPASDEGKTMGLRIYKNGAVYTEKTIQFASASLIWRASSGGTGWDLSHEAIVISDDDDYWEVFGWMDGGQPTDWNVKYDSGELQSYFGAYKIIT